MTAAGNTSVMISLRRARRSPTHYALASLAAADLLVGTCVMPLAAARELLVFKISWSICAIWSTLDVLSCTASILSLCALGYERYYGITSPLSRPTRIRRAKILALVVWPTSMLVALPTAFIPSPTHYFETNSPKACTVNTNIGYVFVSAFTSFYVPVCVMIHFYAHILRALSTQPSIRSHRGRGPVRQDGECRSKIDRKRPATTVVVENSSGYVESQLPATTVVEENSSGNIVTQQSVTKVVAQNSSGNTETQQSVTTFVAEKSSKNTETQQSATTVEAENSSGNTETQQSVTTVVAEKSSQNTETQQSTTTVVAENSSENTETHQSATTVIAENSSRNETRTTKRITVPQPQNFELVPIQPGSSALIAPSPAKSTCQSMSGNTVRQKRATRTIIMLMTLFLICWTPFFIMLPIDSICDECVSETSWQWCTWLGYTNSALNPVVYASAAPSVRRALRMSINWSSKSN